MEQTLPVSSHDLLPFDGPSLRRQLLAWFAINARDLPWRHNRDPYRIWLSEVMLQQTTVAAVVPYFARFLARYPTLPDLARATLPDVLRLWEGLGYYRRARDLHKAAGLVVEKWSGELPTNADELRQLPGFGRYTTNAVLSQAFDTRLPILEANSVRLLCRLFAVTDDPKATGTQKLLWRLAAEMLPRKHVGNFNQALMELGALVCTPRQPNCPACPLAKHCQAFRQGLVDVVPRKSPRPAVEEVREVAVVLRRRNKVLLVQRGSEGRWAEMWEFPHAAYTAEQTPQEAGIALLQSLGFEMTLTGEIATLRHVVTRFRITLTAFEAEHDAGRFRLGVYPRAAWLLPQELSNYPVSTPQRKLATLVQAKAAG